MAPYGDSALAELEQEMALARVLREQALAERQSALGRATATPSLDPASAFLQGILNITPGLIGLAVSGKRGAAAGLEAGIIGGNQYGEVLKTRQKNDQARAAQEYEIAKDDYEEALDRESDARKEKRTLGVSQEKFEASEARKDIRSRNRDKALQGPDGTNKITEKRAMQIEGMQESISIIEGTLLPMIENIPEDSTLDYAINKIAEVNPNSDPGKLRNTIKGVTRIIADAGSTGVLTDRDVEDWALFISGGPWASNETRKEFLTRISDRLQKGVRGVFQHTRDPSVDAYEKRFDAFMSQYSSPSEKQISKDEPQVKVQTDAQGRKFAIDPDDGEVVYLDDNSYSNASGGGG